MSISAVTSNSFYAPVTASIINPASAIRQDFQQLSSSLQTNDLAGAQQAYSNLEQALTATQTGSTTGPNLDAAQTDFSNLGKALSAGNLQDAQTAFAQLSNDLAPGAAVHSAQKTHHHHKPAPTQPPTSVADRDGDRAVAGSGSTVSLLA